MSWRWGGRTSSKMCRAPGKSSLMDLPRGRGTRQLALGGDGLRPQPGPRQWYGSARVHFGGTLGGIPVVEEGRDFFVEAFPPQRRFSSNAPGIC
jgi:hypothetical protein